MPAAVRAVELTKQYDIYPRPIDRLTERITGKPRHTVFPALQELSFEVDEGETIGIIGQNGAGKSTLLKLLCGVTQPTSGTIEVKGTVASILELGAGFHPEFSGRDNAALNAAILGLSPQGVRRRLPEIIEFSELGEFIDRPVKTYSSGMYMRLAFSVAVNVDPDILVIDEALAVGDGRFQKKCIDRIRQFQTQQKTILFCSHALYYVTEICRRTLWLDRGTMMRFGSSVDVVHEYESFLLQRDRALPAATPQQLDESPSGDVEIVDRDGRPRTEFESGDDVTVVVRRGEAGGPSSFRAEVEIRRAADDFRCFATSSEIVNDSSVRLELRDVRLVRGQYDVVVRLLSPGGDLIAQLERRSAIEMVSDRFEIGLVEVRRRWSVAPDAVRR